MITFIARNNSNNLGDILSKPSNYFEMFSEEDTCIMGGGQWNIFETKYEDITRTVLWSVGVSIKILPISICINELPFLHWKIRDIDFVDQSRFLPCVSCMHPEIFDDPQGNKTLYYFNSDHSLKFGNNILLNNSPYNKFIEKWKEADTIVSNSYHGLYWGLLSNRKVIPIGYSSKFISLFKMFNLDFPQDNFYSGKNTKYLSKLSLSSYSAKNHLDRFRSMNLQFAEDLRMFDIICKSSVVN